MLLLGKLGKLRPSNGKKKKLNLPLRILKNRKFPYILDFYEMRKFKVVTLLIAVLLFQSLQLHLQIHQTFLSCSPKGMKIGWVWTAT